MNIDLSRCETRLQKCSTRMLMQQPFFAQLLLRMRRVRVDDAEFVSTMATDGTNLFWHPPFVDSQTDAELMFDLAHEVMHPALGHHARRRMRDLAEWNEACDLAINPLLVKAGFTAPRDILMDPQFAGMNAEEIYEKRRHGMQRQLKSGKSAPDNQQQGPPGTGSRHYPGQRSQPMPAQRAPKTQGGIGQVLDAVKVDPQTGAIERASPAETERQAAEWKVAAEQAANSSKNRGNLPGDIELTLDAEKQPKPDWREVLHRFVTDACDPSDYCWSQPNRRYISDGLYLPSVVKERIGELVVVVDTSRSIERDQLSQIADELRAILADARPDKIHVVYCDARVQRVRELTPWDEIELEPCGGGGTDFRPAFEWVEEQRIQPQCLIYFTDMYGTFPTQQPEYPVMWVTINDNWWKSHQAPFGEMLPLTHDEQR